MSQFFPTDLIIERATIPMWEYEEDYKKENNYYLGVDFAAYGGDENAFVICEMIQKKMRIVKCFTTERVSATDTIGRVQHLDNKYKFRKIFVDDAGLGSAITETLQERLGKRKVIGLNNATKRVITHQNLTIDGQDHKDEVPRGIFKEDLYSNALTLMETARLDMIRDLDLIRSVKCIIFSYGDNEKETVKKSHIFGNYAHLTEALVRACWCNKERGLTPFIG